MDKDSNSKAPYDLEERTFLFAKKDFSMRIKISRKEAKESAYWLRLIRETNISNHEKEAELLQKEAVELKKIFSSIFEKSK